MPFVHAYTRTKPHEVQVGGLTLQFAANETGEQVCDVPQGPALDRLLELSEGYLLYGATPAQPEPEDEEPAFSKYVFSTGNETGTVDLLTLDRAGLLEFIAEQELSYKPHGNVKIEAVRDRIVELMIDG